MVVVFGCKALKSSLTDERIALADLHQACCVDADFLSYKPGIEHAQAVRDT